MNLQSRLKALVAPAKTSIRRDTAVVIWPWGDQPAGMASLDDLKIESASWVMRIPPGSRSPFNVRAGDYLPWLGSVIHRIVDAAGNVVLVVKW